MSDFLPSRVLKFCPFCGQESFKPTKDGNCLQCSVCKKSFYINAASAVACVIENNEGEILFTRRAFEPAKGMLDLPGGFVDIGETAESAVKREVYEELNAEVTDALYICSSPNQYLYGGIVYFTLDLAFKCVVKDFSTIRAADDIDDYMFLHKNQIDMNKIAFQSIRNILQFYCQS
jgi:ADP-ribose pyrophosphatase YjhB (NUDIX family)